MIFTNEQISDLQFAFKQAFQAMCEDSDIGVEDNRDAIETCLELSFINATNCAPLDHALTDHSMEEVMDELEQRIKIY